MLAKLCGVDRGRHLYSAGRPSRWALAHILVIDKVLIYAARIFLDAVCTRRYTGVYRAVRAKFHYASWFEAGRRQVRSQISLRYLVPIRSWSATSFEPASVMEFGFNK